MFFFFSSFCTMGFQIKRLLRTKIITAVWPWRQRTEWRPPDWWEPTPPRVAHRPMLLVSLFCCNSSISSGVQIFTYVAQEHLRSVSGIWGFGVGVLAFCLEIFKIRWPSSHHCYPSGIVHEPSRLKYSRPTHSTITTPRLQESISAYEWILKTKRSAFYYVCCST